MRSILKSLLALITLLIFFGCDDSTTGSSGSNAITSSDVAGNWILIKDYEEETEDGETIKDSTSYTLTTSDMIISIASNLITSYFNYSTETEIELIALNPSKTLADNLVESFSETGASGSVATKGDTLVFVVTYSETGYSYKEIITFVKYSGTIPPSHWPAIPTEDIPSNATSLTTSSNISSSIETSGDEIWYSFSATSGTTYTITTGGILDSHLRLYKVNGSELTLIGGNDDYNEDFNSQIVWVCPTTATYYVSVRGFDDSETGNFTLSLKANRNRASSSFILLPKKLKNVIKKKS